MSVGSHSSNPEGYKVLAHSFAVSYGTHKVTWRKKTAMSNNLHDYTVIFISPIYVLVQNVTSSFQKF